MSTRQFGKGAVVLAALGVVGAIAYWSFKNRQPNPPAGVRCFLNSKRVPVTPTDGEIWTNNLHVTQLTKLKSGDVVAPVLRVVRPNYRGFMGGVRHDPVWEETFHTLGEGQAKLDIPIDDEIDKYIVLVRRAKKSGPDDDVWRIWTFTPREIDDVLKLPNFDTLILLSSRNDAGPLLDKDRRAKAYAMELRK